MPPKTKSKPAAEHRDVYRTLVPGVMPKPAVAGSRTAPSIEEQLPAGHTLRAEKYDRADLDRLVGLGLVQRIAVPVTAPEPATVVRPDDPDVQPEMPSSRVAFYRADAHLVVRTLPSGEAQVYAGKPLPSNAEPGDVLRLVAADLVTPVHTAL